MLLHCYTTKCQQFNVIIVLFVETPRKFITAAINLRGVSTNKTIICFIAMQTYKELNFNAIFEPIFKNPYMVLTLQTECSLLECSLFVCKL
jgi:hypothetical protein